MSALSSRNLSDFLAFAFYLSILYSELPAIIFLPASISYVFIEIVQWVILLIATSHYRWVSISPSL